MMLDDDTRIGNSKWFTLKHNVITKSEEHDYDFRRSIFYVSKAVSNDLMFQTTLNPEAQMLLDALRVAQLNQGDMFALQPTPWVVGTVLELKSDTDNDVPAVRDESQSPEEEEDDL